jgi:hypothetical protein
MTPVAAEIVDDRWVVTEMTGVGSSYNIVSDYGGCEPDLRRDDAGHHVRRDSRRMTDDRRHRARTEVRAAAGSATG